MAYLSNLPLKNTSGNTKSIYSLINAISNALGIVNEKVYYLGVDAQDTVEVEAEDGANYFFDTTDEDAEITLPLSSENVGMKVYAKIQAGTGICTFKRAGSDEIDGAASDLVLGTAGDYAELLATQENGWVTKYLLVQP